MSERWEHFDDGAGIGVRGFGASKAAAFEQAAPASTAVIADPDSLAQFDSVDIACESADDEGLLVGWLNALVHEMAVRHTLFSRFQVQMDGPRLRAMAFGEAIVMARHRPAVEVKGATFTALLRDMDDKAFKQAVNVASLPGIVRALYVMPDAHWGCGFPIGGVAAFDADAGGVVSAGGVGFDISYGVRCLHTGQRRDDILALHKRPADGLFKHIPAGLGSTGAIPLGVAERDAMLNGAAKWAVRRGWGSEADLERIEERGQTLRAKPGCVSEQARKRQRDEMGTLGSGNHCLACARLHSELGRDSLGAMRAAINCALANRQILAQLVWQVFADIVPAAKLPLLYDGSHNTCKHASEGLAFSSACHGAGRAMSRHQAMKTWHGREVVDELAGQGILVRSPWPPGIAEEAPGAYKEAAAVVDAAEAAGLARKVATLAPQICVKG